MYNDIPKLAMQAAEEGVRCDADFCRKHCPYRGKKYWRFICGIQFDNTVRPDRHGNISGITVLSCVSTMRVPMLDNQKILQRMNDQAGCICTFLTQEIVCRKFKCPPLPGQIYDVLYNEQPPTAYSGDALMAGPSFVTTLCPMYAEQFILKNQRDSRNAENQ